MKATEPMEKRSCLSLKKFKNELDKEQDLRKTPRSRQKMFLMREFR
ncbi:Uncharacterised protein [Legionella pneumophila]|nr:Uncharacterised protein [Legionella pneumophila]